MAQTYKTLMSQTSSIALQKEYATTSEVCSFPMTSLHNVPKAT